MTPVTLLIIVGLVWAAVLVGLLRLLAAMERVERETAGPRTGLPGHTQGVRGARRG